MTLVLLKYLFFEVFLINGEGGEELLSFVDWNNSYIKSVTLLHRMLHFCWNKTEYTVMFRYSLPRHFTLRRSNSNVTTWYFGTTHSVCAPGLQVTPPSTAIYFPISCLLAETLTCVRHAVSRDTTVSLSLLFVHVVIAEYHFTFGTTPVSTDEISWHNLRYCIPLAYVNLPSPDYKYPWTKHNNLMLW